MKTFDLSIAVLSLIVIVLGLFYKRLSSSPFNEIFLATIIGIALSPIAFNVLEVATWSNKEQLMDKACRLTLAMALLATAFRIPRDYPAKNKAVQATLLLLVMPAMFLTSGVIIHFVIGLDWLVSLLIGAVITPTDPILASTIVSGEKAEELLPQRLRDTISFESGANDGLAFPFVMLCVLLIDKPGEAWHEWFTKTLLWETGGAIVLGLVLGYLFGRLLEFCVKKDYTAKPAILAFALSVALFILTALELIQVNGILAIFVAGLMLKRILNEQENIEEEDIQEMMERLFTLPVFVFFGLILPWEQWLALGWRALGLVVLVLLLRRLPFLFIFKPLLKDFRLIDLAFMGWFGPMGVAALFYCFFSYSKLPLEEIWPITSLIVFSSVVVHGTTAYPLLKLYGKKNNSYKSL